MPIVAEPGVGVSVSGLAITRGEISTLTALVSGAIRRRRRRRR